MPALTRLTPRPGLPRILADVAVGRDVIPEAPPKRSKSTLLWAIAAECGIPPVLGEGNAEVMLEELLQAGPGHRIRRGTGKEGGGSAVRQRLPAAWN